MEINEEVPTTYKGGKMHKYLVVVLLIPVLMAVAVEQPETQNALHRTGSNPVLLDRTDIVQTGEYAPVWEELQKRPTEVRDNMHIAVELGSGASNEALVMAQNIADLWNSGSYNAALALFPELAKLTDPREIAISNRWRQPIETPPAEWGADVRVGTRDSVIMNILDIDNSTGNLFIVLLYPSGSSYYWSMNFSTNGGTSWSETYQWYASYEINSIGLGICQTWAYVGYTGNSGQDGHRIRRFTTNNGQEATFPGGASYVTAYTASDELLETELLTNVDSWDNRIYVLGLTSAGDLLYYYDDQNCQSFDPFATGITNADRALDACWNEGYADIFTLFSYINTSNELKVYGNDGAAWSELYSRATGSPGTYYSAIAAYQDTFICAFEYYGAGLWIRYATSYNAGSSWLWGSFDDTTTSHESPDITARNGGGEGAIYRFYTSPRQLRYTWRPMSGSWSTPVYTTENEPYYNQPSIEYLGGNVFGIAYACWNDPYIRAAYFTRSDWTGTAENKQAQVSPLALTLAPNPSYGVATLSFTIPTAGRVLVSMYDASGRHVQTLHDHYCTVGSYSIPLTQTDLASGIYFLKVETPSNTSTVPMTIVR